MATPSFQSLSQAVEAYYEELRQFIHQRTGSPVMAEDVVQETWIRANTSAVTMPDNPRAYLYRTASNIATDHLRRQQSRSRAVGPLDDELDSETAIEQTVSPLPGPEEATIQAMVCGLPLAVNGQAVWEPGGPRRVSLKASYSF